MAGAKTHKRVFKLEDVEVPEWMTKGNKFIKWDEVCYVTKDNKLA